MLGIPENVAKPSPSINYFLVNWGTYGKMWLNLNEYESTLQEII